MPLSRFQLKSEYGLGAPELYSEASKREDPRAVLDGVAVAGLVGLLRQLGDLAEFAADIFHGLQEQMTNTASRSRKLATRVKRIEAALPPLEKAMLSQRNHIHYAYTPGFQWHARIRNEQNHLIYTYLPRCIMDSYEECREPPSLLALDKFDTGGPGSCLKRYSDPTFFRKASGSSDIQNYEKSNKKKKARKTKKRRASKQSNHFAYDALKIDSSGRVRFSSQPQQQQSSPSRTASIFDMAFKSDLVDRSEPHGSGDGKGFIECVFHASASTQTDKTKSNQPYPQSGNELILNLEAECSEGHTVAADDDNPRASISGENDHGSSAVTWDEKAEIVNPVAPNYEVHQELPNMHETSSEFGQQESDSAFWNSVSDEVQAVDEADFQFDDSHIEPMKWDSGVYEVPKVQKTKFEPDDPVVGPMSSIPWSDGMPEGYEKCSKFDEPEREPIDRHTGHSSESHEQREPTSKNFWGNGIGEMHDKNFEFDEQGKGPKYQCPAGNEIPEECEKSSELDEWEGKPIDQDVGDVEVPRPHEESSRLDELEREPPDQHSWGYEIAENHNRSFGFDEQETKPMYQSSVGNEVPEVYGRISGFDEQEREPKDQISWSNEIAEVYDKSCKFDEQETEPICQLPGGNEMLEVSEKGSKVDEQEMQAVGLHSLCLTRLEVHGMGLQPHEQEMDPEIEESLSKGHEQLEDVDSPEPIFYKNGDDDVESETDNFVDARNTIESESENDVDCQTKGEFESYSHPKEEDSEGDANNERMSDDIDDSSVESKSPLATYDDINEGIHNSSNDLLVSACENSLQLTSASHDISGNEPCENRENSMTMVHFLEASSLEGIKSSSVQDVSSRINFSINNDNAESLQMEPSSSENLAQTDVGIEYSACAPRQDLPKSSDVAHVAFWTNGGMLGLQPSKPPDFSSSGNVDNNGHKSDCVAPITAGPLNENLKPKDDSAQGKVQSPANRCDYGDIDFEQPALFSGYSEAHPYKELPLPLSDSQPERKLDVSVDSVPGRSSAHSLSQILPCVVQPETYDREEVGVRHTMIEAIHADEGRPFLTGFHNDFPTDGCQRSRSMESDEGHEFASFQKAHDLEIGPHVTLCHSSSGANLPQELPSSDSAPPSPLLDHMKISFHPFSSFETSKLKLKYPDRSGDHDETLDAFPSFQLVPESTLQHIGSESDDDTFCRTNPCVTDDEFSHLSDSNSELWESDDSLESRDHFRYGGLHRISPGESISSLFEREELSNMSTRNGFRSIHVEDMMGSSPLPDIPLLQAMDSFRIQEAKLIDHPKAPTETSGLHEPTPESPPLPPMQWRVSESHTDASERKESALGSVFPHHAKVASDHLIHSEIEQMYVTMRNKHLDDQKLKVNVDEIMNQAVNKVDGQDDFLHQIRTKSFNLRKTGLLKPTPTPVAPATNVKVTAILEKASAIRKAVASDDGDDDDQW